MTFKSFSEFRLLKEASDNKEKSQSGVPTRVSLGEGNDFSPFYISDDPKSEHYGRNKNLAPIVRAFKKGGNWGWSKDDSSGDDKPVKISGKKLFLAGGAVRDHLKGKKARNIELATNASPDEVYHILKQNSFTFVKENVPNGEKQIFWVKKKNKDGRPFAFGIKVNSDEFELEIFTKTPRGVDSDPESGTQVEDAAGRDFTINGMYILLSNDNGPNKELHDFHGGIHHLIVGRISPIGDINKKFKEDPTRLLRYVRFLSGYGDVEQVSNEEKQAIRNLAKDISKLDRQKVVDEFKKGMDKEDCNCREYLRLFRDLGMIDHIFPGKNLDSDLPKELSELGDKHMSLAWMLRNNDPSRLNDIGFDPKDIGKIVFLINSLGISESIDAQKLIDLTNGYLQSGISGRKLREWGTKIGNLDNSVVDAFLNYVRSPRVKIYKMSDNGSETIAEEFADLVDPFTGRQDVYGIDDRKKNLELDNFRKHIKFMKPN